MKIENWEDRSGEKGFDEEMENTRPFDPAEIRRSLKEDFEQDRREEMSAKGNMESGSDDSGDYDKDALMFQMRRRQLEKEKNDDSPLEEKNVEKEPVIENNLDDTDELFGVNWKSLNEQKEEEEAQEPQAESVDSNISDTEDRDGVTYEIYEDEQDNKYEDEEDGDEGETHDREDKVFVVSKKRPSNQGPERYDKENVEPPKKKSSFFVALRDWVLPLVAAVALALIIRMFIGGATTVKGESMYPTLSNGDILLVSKIPTYSHQFKRSDIVILDSPDHPDELYVKRVIGLPGETVEIHDGKVFIDGLLLVEHYIKDIPTESYQDNVWVLSSDQYFVMGDNRNPGASNDSRLFGPVPADRLEAVARFRIWPLTHMKSFY